MAWLSKLRSGSMRAHGSYLEGDAGLSFTERRRLIGFLRTAYAVCEGLYSRGSLDGRSQLADGRPLFPEVDRVLMEQAWRGYMERHGAERIRLSLDGRCREDFLRAGLLSLEWKQTLNAIAVVQKLFVSEGTEEAFRSLIMGVNGVLDGLMGVAHPDPALAELRDLMRDLQGKQLHASGDSASARSSTCFP